MFYPPWTAATAGAKQQAQQQAQQQQQQPQQQKQQHVGSGGRTLTPSRRATAAAALADPWMPRARQDEAKYVPMSNSFAETRPSSVMDLVARLSPAAPASATAQAATAHGATRSVSAIVQSTAARDAGGQRDATSSAPKQGESRSDVPRLTASLTRPPSSPPASLSVPMMGAKTPPGPSVTPASQQSQASPGSVAMAPVLPAKTKVRRKSPVPLPRAASPGPHAPQPGVTPPLSPKSQIARSMTPPLTPTSRRMAARSLTRSMTPPRRLGQAARSITPPRTPLSASAVAPVQVPSSSSSSQPRRSLSQLPAARQQASDGTSSPLSRGRTFGGSFRFSAQSAGDTGAAVRSVTPPRSHDWAASRSVRQLASNIRRHRFLPQTTLSGQQVSSAALSAGISSYHRSSGSSGGPTPLKAATNALARLIASNKVGANSHGGSATVAAAASPGSTKLPNWQRGAAGAAAGAAGAAGAAAGAAAGGGGGSGVYRPAAASPAQLRSTTPVQERDASPVLTQCSSSSSVRSTKLANPKTPNHASAAALVPLAESSTPSSPPAVASATSPAEAAIKEVHRALQGELNSHRSNFEQATARPQNAPLASRSSSQVTGRLETELEEKPACPSENGSSAPPETAVVLTLEMQREAIKRSLASLGEGPGIDPTNWKAEAAALKKSVEKEQNGIVEAMLRQMTPLDYYAEVRDSNHGTAVGVATCNGDNLGEPAQRIQAVHENIVESVHKDLDECGRTMLIYAASEGDVATVEALLHEGAMIDSPDECGCTALTYAARRGHLGAVQCLARRGAELDAPSLEGWTPLIAAAAAGHAEVVRCLVQTGAGVDLRDAKGWSALMHATYNRFLPTVICLLDHGASPMVTDTEGRSALAYAAYHGDLGVAQALVQRHPSASRRADEAAGIALHNAVMQGHSEVSRCLLGMPLPRPVRAAAMKLAVERGHFSIVETIVRQVHVDSQCVVPAAIP